MIKRLRARFIIATMLSLLIVLGIIMTTINIISYSRVRKNADELLKMLLEYNGHLDDAFGNGEIPPPKPPHNAIHGERFPNFVNPETPYESRYFAVSYENGVVIDTSHIASIDDDEAIALSDKVLASGKKSGYEGMYRFLAKDNTVVFLDCTRQLEVARSFLLASIFGSLGGALGVFVLVLIFSKKAVAPIARSYERQKRFITDAGHELKTPLTIISASNELIEMTHGESENTLAISKQISRMNAMVRNLSTLASLDEIEHSTEKSTLPLSFICQEACNLFDPVVKKGGRRFDISIEGDITCQGNEGLLRQLLSVTLENAGKYALSFTSFKLSRVGKHACITIANDASGIANGDLSRCFERFYRTDEARASGLDGSGIGLCVASEIVTLHGGEISASGQDGIFTLKIII